MLALNVARDGAKLVTGSADKSIKIWTIADAKNVATLAGHAAPVKSVFLSNDGNRLASGSADNSVRFWDVPNA